MAHRRGWSRDEALLDDVSRVNDEGRLLVFVTDVDYGTAWRRPRGIPGSVPDDGPEPVVRVYGVTPRGEQVHLRIHGFLPYFYCEVPDDIELPTHGAHPNYKRLAEQLRAAYSRARPNENGEKRGEVRESVVCAIEPLLRPRLNMIGAEPVHVMRLTFTEPRFISRVRDALEQGRVVWSVDNGVEQCLRPINTYESDIAFALRYMIDYGVVGGGWLSVDRSRRCVPSAYWTGATRDEAAPHEYDVHCEQVRSEPDMDALPANAARILSFDIECCGERGQFPVPDRHPVIQIANHVKCVGAKETLLRVVFVLGTCAPLTNGVRVLQFQTEAALLREWGQFVRITDPDFVTGYNIDNFDLRYIVDRAAVLGVKLQLGRLAREDSRVECQSFSSSAYGTTDWNTVRMRGRVSLDMLRVIKRDVTIKLRTYTLGAVATHFLSQQKEDVDHKEIPGLHRGTAADRARLASYCNKDAELPLLLMDRLMVMTNMIEMARVTGVPISYLLERGQQIKVVSQICRMSSDLDYIMPNLTEPQKSALWRESLAVALDAQKGEGVEGGAQVRLKTHERKHTYKSTSMTDYFERVKRSQDEPLQSIEQAKCHMDERIDDEKYIGAIVISPIPGFYRDPIATLDFAALYPSIIRCHNICFSTLLRGGDADVKRLELDMERDVTVSPSGHYFVRSHIRRGLLPAILDQLIEARGRAKRAMAAATGPFERAVYNGRQLALKVSANSVYGFTGARRGRLPCVALAMSVTTFGRDMIDHTKAMVERHYTRANGYAHDAQVIYGDTDSVMVKFGVSDIAESIALGKDAAERITATFQRPVELEFEKCYMPYLLVRKKRYAGLLWTRADKPDYLDQKGLESVRRDNCKLVPELFNMVLNRIMAADIDGALSLIRQTLSDLAAGLVDMSKLVISRGFVKRADSYKSKQVHVELAARMAARNSDTAPQLGDRVQYVMTCGVKGAKAHELSEDPLHALETRVPIDVRYYIEKQLRAPLERILANVVSAARLKQLFEGDHVRRRVPLSADSRVGIMRHFRVRPLCPACSARPGAPDLCAECAPRAAELLERKRAAVELRRRAQDTCWDICRACQGDNFGVIECTASHCFNFYQRRHLTIAYEEDNALLQRFESIEW